jgi:hypothetical protein
VRSRMVHIRLHAIDRTLSDVGGQGRKRKKVDCSMECTSKLIYMRDMNVHVSV